MTDLTKEREAKIREELVAYLNGGPPRFAIYLECLLSALDSARQRIAELEEMIRPGQSDEECAGRCWRCLDIGRSGNHNIERMAPFIAARVDEAEKPWREMVKRLVSYIGPFEDTPISPATWPKVCDEARALLQKGGGT